MVVPFPLRGGSPLDPPNWEQTPVVVQDSVIHLRAVIRQQAGLMSTFEARRFADLGDRRRRNSAHGRLSLIRPRWTTATLIA